MILNRTSRLTRRRPRDFGEWRALRRWGKLCQREAQQPGYVLRSARQDAGLTQNQLAERLKISQQAVSLTERWGANPTAELMFAWAQACERRLELRFSDLERPRTRP
ncbi:MAG: hypothetical protein DRJ65_01020 [Acidobacteria bacterium]|nr:MAG: hypothetical protein DRJ65_01020 [Acidobacteriota bacterium]